MDTAGHNIANAQTEGFSRQRVNLKQREPLEVGRLIIGDGVYVGDISRTHDKFVERQLNLAQSDLGNSNARFEALQSLEAIYSPEMQASVSDKMTNFFNSLQELSSQPDQTPVRANVKEAARDLTMAFHRVDEVLERHRKDIDLKIEGEAQEINSLLDRISKLNVAIGGMEAGSPSQASDLRDQQDLLMRKLSEKIDISYYVNKHGMLAVRGPQQTLLVDGKFTSKVFAVRNGNTGNNDIIAYDSEGGHPRNITSSVENGGVKALIDVRDNVIGGLIKHNNEMAHTIAGAFNEIHREGFGLSDYKEMNGRDFFEISADINQAAKSLKITDLINEDSNAISAAATPHAPGDNIIINRLVGLRNERIMENGRATLQENYSNYVGVLGIEIERAGNKLAADDVIFGDWTSKREAISGVSLDEEAVNLLRWQTAFAASSKVITTVDEMLETVLSLKR